ncbi:hypothetical protein QAD02_021584 [Eretmocerus hayati]|uniref:Uncharacterized protein n=1 Tax=Eretmocerus hayati TaxID=131215 RepID=A0ACC2PQK8_9HYME|nr:hypothetical protein QAD02_021584 [Eretmocerus hayati]
MDVHQIRTPMILADQLRLIQIVQPFLRTLNKATTAHTTSVDPSRRRPSPASVERLSQMSTSARAQTNNSRRPPPREPVTLPRASAMAVYRDGYGERHTRRNARDLLGGEYCVDQLRWNLIMKGNDKTYIETTAGVLWSAEEIVDTALDITQVRNANPGRPIRPIDRERLLLLDKFILRLLARKQEKLERR